MNDHLELEEKYRPELGDAIPDLTALQGVASLSEPRTARLEAVYFDTHERSLLRAGVTLRRRTGGEDAGWHLKVPAGDGRLELQLPLSRARRTPPKELREDVLGWTRGAPLTALATIVTERTTIDLRDRHGGVLAQLADDTVAGTPHVHDDSGSDVGETVRWREWELELVAGDESLLTAAATLFARAGVPVSPDGTKLSRVLGAPVPLHVPLPPPGRSRPAQNVLHAWLAEQVAELDRRDHEIRRAHGGLAKQETDEGVHKARVACRRLQGALATYRPFMDREVTDPIRGELRWLARTLGPARDLDVAHVRLREMVDHEPAGLVVGPVRSRLDRVYLARRREAHEAALAALRSTRYFALRETLDHLVAAPPWTEKAAEEAQDVLPPRLRREYKRLRRRVKTAQSLADPTQREERDLAIHAARRAAKRLRYAAEAVEPVWGPDAKDLAKAAKRFASALGTRQDAVVAAGDLLALAREADDAGESAFTYGRLHAREQQVAADIGASFTDLWKRASRKKLRTWLR